MIRALFKRLRKDDRGITVLEFALISPVFMMLLLGTLELGYMTYFKSLMNGVLEEAARRSAVGGITSGQTDDFIRQRIKVLMPAGKRNDNNALTIQKRAFHNFSNVNQPERITSDTNPVGTYNSTDCYEDANLNGVYDASGGSNGVGGADDIIFYTVTAAFPHLFPIANLFDTNPNLSIEVNAVIRNQPFSQQNTPPVRCS
ncbi:MAG TPA: pilus assembly protein [Chakrabartia sp.]|nr:pilus assembly protein [Chakrabartia sp.]